MDLVNESEDLQLCPGEKVITNSTVLSSVDSPSFKSFLMNNLTTPTTTESTSSYNKSSTRVPSSARPTHENKSHTPQVSSSYPTNSFMKSAASASNSIKPVVFTQKCTSVVWAKRKSASRRVNCSNCDTKYCFECLLPYHAPNSCKTIKKWLAKCQDDSETRNYLLVHTQDCPKCKVCIKCIRCMVA